MRFVTINLKNSSLLFAKLFILQFWEGVISGLHSLNFQATLIISEFVNVELQNSEFSFTLSELCECESCRRLFVENTNGRRSLTFRQMPAMLAPLCTPPGFCTYYLGPGEAPSVLSALRFLELRNGKPADLFGELEVRTARLWLPDAKQSS